jgi:hypothetical protein
MRNDPRELVDCHVVVCELGHLYDTVGVASKNLYSEAITPFIAFD